jgi:hypothetical protein
LGSCLIHALLAHLYNTTESRPTSQQIFNYFKIFFLSGIIGKSCPAHPPFSISIQSQKYPSTVFQIPYRNKTSKKLVKKD